MITFERVTRVYDESGWKALDDARFRIEKGEFVLLTGPSGAGKSTVLRLMYMDETPDSGEVRLSFGRDEAYRSPGKISRGAVQRLRRRLGIVFQDFKLLDDRDVFENVALALRIADAPEAKVKQRVLEVLALTGLSRKARSLPKELSGGEQQRVAIARAMANHPHILLADEPTGNLDPDTSLDILNIFQNIHATGTAVLMATHDYGLIEALPYRRLHLENGKLTEQIIGAGAEAFPGVIPTSPEVFRPEFLPEPGTGEPPVDPFSFS